MSNKAPKKREEIALKYKWDIEAMYPDESLWEKDLEKAVNLSEDAKKYHGRITESASTLLSVLRADNEIWATMEHAFVYAAMKKDEDNRVSKYQGMDDKSGAAIAKIAANLSFITPELMEADKEKIIAFINEEPELKTYEFSIMSLLRTKDHILSEKEENILAQMSEITGATNDVFKMLNNADMKFGTVLENGKEVPLTHGNYIQFMESQDRELRKQAFTNMYEAYKALNNTLSTNYNYNVKTDVVSARIRNYPSSLDASLYPANIPTDVYHNLISEVHEYLPVLHKYIGLRKKVLGVDELKMYDVYCPLVSLPEREISFEEAIDIITCALEPMGEEYVEQVKKGVAARWIDVYENEGKTSGAYSFGAYDSMPYILLNYSSSLKDVFTIIHEMGHSMHSYYTRKNQPFCYGDHSIFTAEVASTVNESLLIKYLLNKETDPEMRKYLINYYIEEFRTTLFRQTMFAEFELLAHEEIEKGGVLTSDFLNNTYETLNKEYFGEEMADDEYIKYEWSRIPHFYRGFYVYQYATGYSAATAISKKILEEGVEARNNYIEFLKSGSSNYPVELLKIAGVDMASSEPVKMAMETFKNLVEEFENLL